MYFLYCFRYVPTLLWGKSGHLQTFIYAKLGRVKSPFPKGNRHYLEMPDGALMTFDVFEPYTSHKSKGKIIVSFYVVEFLELIELLFIVDYDFTD